MDKYFVEFIRLFPHRLSRASRDFLRRLEATDLFANVGKPLDGPFARVGSWDEAIERINRDDSESASLEASNRIADQLPKMVHQRWNNVADAVKARFDPLIRVKLAQSIAAGRAPERVMEAEAGILWDLVFVGMELEYRRFAKPHYFTQAAELYLQGHFPCGWQGDFPRGRIVVF
jgi:hypothetical protein